jgi:hypothetical protein
MRRSGVRVVIVLATILVVAQPLVPATGASREDAGGLTSSESGGSERSIKALRQTAKGPVYVSMRQSTGVAASIRTGVNGDLFPASSAETARVKALGFLERFGGAFGIDDDPPPLPAPLRL